MSLRRSLIQHLQSWQRAGVSDWKRLESSSRDRPAKTSAATVSAVPVSATPLPTDHNASSLSPITIQITDEIPSVTAPKNQPKTESKIVPPSSAKALPPGERLQELEQLSQCVADCRRCTELAETRTQTVFGTGDPNATLMFIGEAPGADEDRTGEPFVGRAGKLMSKIIEACHWNREDLYICNILKCRPPGNRNPSPEESENCREYLDAQIRLVDPDFIVCWGSVAAKNLLDSKEPIGRLRKQFFSHGNASVLCTYHPSYLLRNPPAKKFVWEDLQLLMQKMSEQSR